MLPSLTRRFRFCSVGPVCFLARINRSCIVPAGCESRTRLCAACCVLKTAAWRRWPGPPSSRAKNSKHTERRTERPTWLNWSKEARTTKRDAGSYQGHHNPDNIEGFQADERAPVGEQTSSTKKAFAWSSTQHLPKNTRRQNIASDRA
jgi:hypothetical protein